MGRCNVVQGSVDHHPVRLLLVESRLHVFGGGALEHDVAALAVKSDQAGTVIFPDIAKLAQGLGVVMQAGRRLHPKGVEFRRFGKFIGGFRETRDDGGAVAAHPDGAAFPIALAGRVGMLELSEQVLHHGRVRLA
jgi:hypothetical protein